MDDLISRQAAINIVEKWFEFMELNGDICIDGLISLPTAEPEIIRCKECIYYENENSGLCDLGGSWDPDDYCSNGRRYKHG